MTLSVIADHHASLMINKEAHIEAPQLHTLWRKRIWADTVSEDEKRSEVIAQAFSDADKDSGFHLSRLTSCRDD